MMCANLFTQNEHEDQVMVVNWARDNARWCPELEFLMSSQNGAYLPHKENRYGNQYCSQARKLISEGMVKGVADLFLPAVRGEFHGLWIELKHEGGRVRPEQKVFIDAMRKFGYKAEICYGYQSAIDLIKEYITIKVMDLST